MSNEKIGLTEEEAKYLEECAKVSEEKWEVVKGLLEFFEKTLAENPESVGAAIEELLKRNG